MLLNINTFVVVVVGAHGFSLFELRKKPQSHNNTRKHRNNTFSPATDSQQKLHVLHPPFTWMVVVREPRRFISQ